MTQNGSLPARVHRLIDQATAEMDARERAAFRAGVMLAFKLAIEIFEAGALDLKNATPTILERPVSIRRVGI